MFKISRATKSIFIVGLLTVATYPIFFFLYRIMIFQTVPRDDYAPYLLWLLHAPGGALPGSPYIYRYLSIVLAWPLYHLLPVFHLTNIPATVPITYQRATAAFAMLSDLCAVTSAVLSFGLAKAIGKSALTALLSGLLVYGCCWFTQIEGIDTVTVLGLVIVTILLRCPTSYWLALVPLTFVNEKIAITTFLFLSVRFTTSGVDRQRLSGKLAFTTFALAVYGITILVVKASGNSYQLTPAGYLGNLLTNIGVNISMRGLLLGWGPLAILLVLALIGMPEDTERLFSRRDVLLVPAMTLLGLVLTQDFQLGRIVMMAIPFFAIPAASRLARLLEEDVSKVVSHR